MRSLKRADLDKVARIRRINDAQVSPAGYDTWPSLAKILVRRKEKLSNVVIARRMRIPVFVYRIDKLIEEAGVARIRDVERDEAAVEVRHEEEFAVLGWIDAVPESRWEATLADAIRVETEVLADPKRGNEHGLRGICDINDPNLPPALAVSQRHTIRLVPLGKRQARKDVGSRALTADLKLMEAAGTAAGVKVGEPNRIARVGDIPQVKPSVTVGGRGGAEGSAILDAYGGDVMTGEKARIRRVNCHGFD